jgi:hypothetical protein
MLLKAWEWFIDFLYKLSLLITYLAIVLLLGFIIYYFYFYDWKRIILGCVVLLVAIHSNKSMKGGHLWVSQYSEL